ncbi:hypothetical protein ACFWBF_08040 [Streptomyces sp. NPDC060028]|uniref:hypothetical protein n=1 Tax=Streptomyces sp. NPDC060028 TaxID=3347041 RepID=UPI0036B979CD
MEGDLVTAYVSAGGTEEVSPEVQQRALKAFLEAYFPVAFPYEVASLPTGRDSASADRMIGAAPVVP